MHDTGCQRGSDEYALPAGNADVGKTSFIELGCNLCHSVGEISWTGKGTGHPHHPLGGETTRVKNYGDLVTSIINPSHKVSRDYIIQRRRVLDDSPMTNYNEVMTIQELINLVTFLHGEYKLVVPDLSYDLPDF